MVLYQEEKIYIERLRNKIQNHDEVSTEELQELITKFEEMVEMSSVSIKIIDRLMHNYDMLKQHNDASSISVKNG